MNKRPALKALASLLLLGASSMAAAQDAPASLATLNKAEGKVMVDKGSGYNPAKANTPLNQGDRVITLDGSAAEIVFADGCKSQLKPNNLMVISAEQGCKAAIAQVTPTGAGATAGSGTPVSQIVGPILIGATAAVLIHEWDDLDSQPISAQ